MTPIMDCYCKGEYPKQQQLNCGLEGPGVLEVLC